MSDRLVEQIRDWAKRLEAVPTSEEGLPSLASIVREMRETANRREKALEQLAAAVDARPTRG